MKARQLAMPRFGRETRKERLKRRTNEILSAVIGVEPDDHSLAADAGRVLALLVMSDADWRRLQQQESIIEDILEPLSGEGG